MAPSITENRIQIFQKNILAAFSKSSIVVKILSVALIIGYLFSFISSAVPYITVTPGLVMAPNFHVYSFALFGFVELHFWNVVGDVAVIILFGKLIEPLWGAMEMLVFFVVVNLGVGILIAFSYCFVFLLTLKEEFLFGVHICGLSGYMAGVLVAVKQVMPDSCLVNFPFCRLRNSHLPLTVLLVAIVLQVSGLLPGLYTYMITSGLVVSWVYLRFYQKRANGSHGDMAENFSLASFFPSQLQPLVAFISNSIFTCLVKIKVCRAPQRKYDISSLTTITVTLPSTEPHDAERRKQLALKALNERLSKTESVPSWPTLDDDEEEDDDDNSNKPAIQAPGLSSAMAPHQPSDLTTVLPKPQIAELKDSYKQSSVSSAENV